MEILIEKAEAQDWPDYLRLVSDPRVMAMITERAIPEDEARDFYDGVLRVNADQTGLGHFRVLQEGNRAFLGFGKLQRKGDEGEVGYMLLPEYWGRGIASRMIELLIAEAANHPDLTGMFAIIDPANIPSRRILTKRGFTSRELRDFDGLPGEVLGRPVILD